MAFWTSRRGLLKGAAGASAAAGLAGCASAQINGLDRTRRSLDISNQGEPLSLDPHKASGVWENNIIGNMFVGLTTEDERAQPVPGMALRWDTSEDGLTWTFHLRQANWSDGTPVTAHDFVFAFRRLLDPASLSEYAAVQFAIKNAEAINSGQITDLTQLGVRAIDDRTLAIDLEYPAAYLPSLLKHYTAYCVPRHVVERHGADWTAPENIVVNGPFTLIKWWSNYIVHLEHNPAFYDADNVAFRELFFYPTTDTNVGARGVAAGERGWATDFPSNQVAELRVEMPGYVRVSPYMLVQYFSLNTTRAPFNDARVRRALAMSLNREFMAEEIYRTGEVPAYSFVPPGLANYLPGARYPWAGMALAQRREEARRLLQEAGFGPNNPLDFTFEHRNTGANPRVAVVVQADWSEIASWVRVRLAGVETQIHYANLRAKNFQAGDGGWVADFNDPKNYLFLCETRTGPQNYSGYSNPEYDRLVAASDRERDLTRRAEMMRDAEQLMLNDAPLVCNVFGVTRNLVHPALTGYQDNVEDIHRARWFGIRDV